MVVKKPEIVTHLRHRRHAEGKRGVVGEGGFVGGWLHGNEVFGSGVIAQSARGVNEARASLTCRGAWRYACSGYMMFIHLLAVAEMPPKESGGWIDRVFDWCVDLLLAWAAALHISYNAINVIIFCIIWPVLTLALAATIIRQRITIRRLARKTADGAGR